VNVNRIATQASVSIALATLAACGGASVAPNVTGASHPAMRAPFAARFVNRDCCARIKTLFVTDAFGGSSFTGAAYMFDLKSGRALGQVAAPPEGFSEVQGACADNNGNVYVANTGQSTVDEYSHSGAYLATLGDPGQFPVTCSYDRASGNLAVWNIISTSGGSGSFSIFNGGVLLNTYYAPGGTIIGGIGYQDGIGLLWVDGTDASRRHQRFFTFSNGTFTPITIKGNAGITLGGPLQWSAKTHAMNLFGSSSKQAALYRISPSYRIAGKTVYACGGSYCDSVGFFIKGSDIVLADAVQLSVSLYRYPAGGKPVMSYSAPYVQPIGVAISPNIP
jgi:hypothetical protein